jgi:hypothetical protein
VTLTQVLRREYPRRPKRKARTTKSVVGSAQSEAAKLQSLLDKYDPDWRDPDILRSSQIVLHYLQMREAGSTHRWAAMCACQKAPGSKTEREFFAGRHTLAQQFAGNEGQLDAIVAAARRKGFEPSANMIYDSTLADDLGDPKAFLTPGGGTTELRRKIEVDGKTAHGAVTVKGRQPENPIPAAPLASDLVDEIIRQRVRDNPDLGVGLKTGSVDRREVVADVQEKHGFTDAKRAGVSTQPIVPQKQSLDSVMSQAAVTSATLKKSRRA